MNICDFSTCGQIKVTVTSAYSTRTQVHNKRTVGTDELIILQEVWVKGIKGISRVYNKPAGLKLRNLSSMHPQYMMK